MQDRMAEWEESNKSERAKLGEREREFIEFSKLAAVRERELEALRARFREEQLEREKQLQQELAAREALFADREKKLHERQRDFEKQLMRRQAEVESVRHHLAEEVARREAKLQQALLELQQEKERYNEESRKRIEKTSNGYVAEALELLDRKEKQFHRLSKIWAAIGALALVGGLGFFGYVSLTTASALPVAITWEFIVFAMSKGLIAVALLAALARYSFLFSNSYMREALKNADRTHAINFGKFYLQSYGAAAEWSEVKEAFAHWNTTGSNAFNPSGASDIDATTAEKAAMLLENLAKSLPRPKSAIS